MTKVTTIHDLHIGTMRAAGTTVPSSKALRMYALEMTDTILDTIDCDLVLNGDVFDGYQVSLYDVQATYRILLKWLGKGHRLFLLQLHK